MISRFIKGTLYYLILCFSQLSQKYIITSIQANLYVQRTIIIYCIVEQEIFLVTKPLKKICLGVGQHFLTESFNIQPAKKIQIVYKLYLVIKQSTKAYKSRPCLGTCLSVTVNVFESPFSLGKFLKSNNLQHSRHTVNYEPGHDCQLGCLKHQSSLAQIPIYPAMLSYRNHPFRYFHNNAAC